MWGKEAQSGDFLHFPPVLTTTVTRKDSDVVPCPLQLYATPQRYGYLCMVGSTKEEYIILCFLDASILVVVKSKRF